jgi:formylglycine-generating enzyme required for sulfatase activity
VHQEGLKPDWVPEADRVSSGGCWYDVPQFARVALRVGDEPAYRNDILGFRLALNINHEGEHNVSDSSP